MNSNETNDKTIIRTGKVLLIYTGGTIGMGSNKLTGALEPLDFEHLIEHLPEFAQIQTGVDTYQFTPPIDSSDMQPSNWKKLVLLINEKYAAYDGFVILHGTDTMAYTASALSFMFENLTKPVILTGSQLPIGQLRTDGKENLVTSIEIAASSYHNGLPIVPEVCVYFNGKLLRGNRSTKQNADEFNAFHSFNYPVLCDVGVNLVFREHNIIIPDYTKSTIIHTEMDASVLSFSLFPGINKEILTHCFKAENVKSIIMRTYGSGNAPKYSWLINLLKEASERGITVVNITQCEAGSVEMNRYDTGIQLKDVGVISGYDSTFESALAKLMFLNAKYNDVNTVREMMNKSLRGEISV